MNAMHLAAVCLVSLIVSALMVLTRRWHARWTGDFEDGGVQKHHVGAPPRVGILPLMAGVLLGMALLADQDTGAGPEAAGILGAIVLASLPAVLLGLADDISKRVTPKVRLVGAVLAALAGIWLLGVHITRIDVPVLDALLTWTPLAVAVTVLMVCGFTNAMNIVDGLNGLSGGLAVVMLAATGFVAWQVEDWAVLKICAIFGFSVLGFLFVNFPRGLMFLGDGGAYFIGFALAQIWILILARHPELSVWFVMAVAAHPTVETVFSIYRRRFMRRRKGAMQADRLHMHSLIYRRRMISLVGPDKAVRWKANALGSMAIVLVAALPAFAGALASTSGNFSVLVFVTYCAAYVWLFTKLTIMAKVPQRGPEAQHHAIASRKLG